MDTAGGRFGVLVEAKRIARREGRVVEGNRIEEWITVSVCACFFNHVS